MTTHLTTLSNFLYEESRERLCESARKAGINSIFSFDFEEIEHTDFYNDNRETLSNVKFLGYWLWKPFIIKEILSRIDENDVLIYADAGVEVIAELDWLIDHCRTTEPIILFGNARDANAVWTKRDAFVMMDCDTPEFWFGPHCDASFLLVRKCTNAVGFINQWLNYGCKKNIITNEPNVCGLPNLEGFLDHRYDQSILSLLAQKHRINLYRIPSQFGNHYKTYQFRIANEFNCESQWNQTTVNYYSIIPYYNSDYGQLLNHHRTKKQTVQVEPAHKASLKTHVIRSLVKIKHISYKIIKHKL